MKKKIIFGLALFLLTISLSACRIPFTNKNITIPFFEKSPEEIIDLMGKKMAEIKTMEYSGSVVINIKNLSGDPVSYMFNEQPKVLGVKEGNAENINTEESGTVPTPYNSMIPTEVKIKYLANGKSDYSNNNNMKDNQTFNLALDSGGMQITLDGETISINNRSYLKIAKLPTPLTMFVDKSIENQWFYINTPAVASSNKIKNKSVNNIIDILRNKEVLKISERFKDENVNNKNSYHFRMIIDKYRLSEVLDDVAINAYTSIFGQNNEENIKSILKSPEYLKFKDALPDIIKSAEGELWIDKNDYYLNKSKFNLSIDLSNYKISTLPVNNTTLDMSIDMIYKSFNSPVTIEAPQKATTIDQIFNSLNKQNSSLMSEELCNLQGGKYIKFLEEGQAGTENFKGSSYVCQCPNGKTINEGSSNNCE